MEADVFALAEAPKNGLDILRWAVYEPKRLEDFSGQLNRKQVALWILRTYVWLFPLCAGAWLAAALITGYFDLPTRFPEQYTSSLQQQWSAMGEGAASYLAITLNEFLVAQVLGLAGGLTLGLAGGSTLGLAFGLASGLAFGLISTCAFYLFYFRLPWYPFYQLKALLPQSLENNPYLKDAVIWLPLAGIKGKLTQDAKRRPELAFRFVNFLLEHRPLQKKLAMEILHAASAAMYARAPFAADALLSPKVLGELLMYRPSARWEDAFAALKGMVSDYHAQTNLSHRRQLLQTIMRALEDFRELQLRENECWRNYYFDFFAAWQKHAAEELARLDSLGKTAESVTRNVYVFGEALHAETDQAIFLGRDDLRETLANEIYSAVHIPTFLIQGQRRVGKTSFINFLPQILGSGFVVAKVDCQDARARTVIDFLRFTLWTVAGRLGIKLPEREEAAAEDSGQWLPEWGKLQTFLEQQTMDSPKRIVLAFDEYENLQQMLRKNPEDGKRLLEAMRSFSQAQKKVVLMFAGSAFFTEQDRPRWSNIFVHAKLLQVDYLKPEDARKLIVVPVADFNLRYSPGMVEEMIRLTQGHPQLLQAMCREMVDIANKEGRSEMEQADLDRVIAQVCNDENLVLNIFYTEFCGPKERKTVCEIIDGIIPADAESLHRLSKHGFIVNEGERWKMRVPLFQAWLEKYRDTALYNLKEKTGD